MLTEKREKDLENYLFKKEDKKLKIKIKNKKKKKIGRPKKRGPKKKRIRRKIIKNVKPRPVIDFKIISTMNGKQNGYIGSYRTFSEAYAKLKELEEENKNVILPRRYLNSEVISTIKDEYLILEKNRFGDKEDSLLRNEFGKFVKHKIINNKNWIVRDKITRLVEENFWVYGYDPKTERKNCAWIYDNLLLNSLESKYDIIRVLVYKNKLVLKYDNKPIGMVICKNKSDSIRLYNFISDNVRNNKIKQIICIGAYNNVSDVRREIENEIMNLTGWNKMKIQRSTT